jgi:hypothetical protein
LNYFKLGRNPGPAPKLKFGAVFSSPALPTVPKSFGRPQLVRSYGMLGNADWGDCVFAGASHETMLLCAEAGRLIPSFTAANALSDYAAVTGFAYTPDTDRGTIVADAMKYRQATGVVDVTGARHKIDAYASITPGNLNQIGLATYLFGVSGIGVMLPSSAEEQFIHGVPWDVIPGDSEISGHYIPCCGRNSGGMWLFITWGRIQAATSRWVQKYMVEGVALISLEILNAKGVSPHDYDLATLQQYLKEVQTTP